MLYGKKRKNLITDFQVRKYFAFILLFVFLFQLTRSNAQEKDSALVVRTLKHGLTDTKNWVLSPLKWNTRDWLIFGGLSATAGALIAWGDQPVYNFANTLHTNFLDKAATGIQPMGNLYPSLAIAGFFVEGVLSKDNYSVETSLIASESILLSTLAVQVVKTVAGRSRPNNFGTTNPHEWSGPFFKGTSFFSGHTVAAFSVASVIAYRYRDTKWVPVLSYGLATLGGLQRIYSNRHWTSDVLVGAAIGTATGIFLCKSWEKSTIHFFPSISANNVQMSVVIPLSK